MTLKFTDIDPKLNPAFSARLHKWVKRNAREGGASLYVTDGTGPAYGRLYVGTFNVCGCCPDDFTGQPLRNVLNGTSTLGYTFTGVAGKMRSADDVEAEYLRVGRCALDPEHEILFADDRWETLGEELRRCRWCGKEAALVNEVRIIKRWRMVTSPLATETAVEAS